MIQSASASPTPMSSENLIKQELADQLRAAIVRGMLEPGMRIVEATWAMHFGVAQASIREAIHILAAEGFVTKASGRSARVVHLSEQDVLHMYELRGALEGLAARLAASGDPQIGRLPEALDAMRSAAKEGGIAELVEADLQFHLELCRISGNPYLYSHARRILLPFFAFVRLRAMARGEGASGWQQDLDAHQRIIDLIRDGEGEVAEHYLRRAMVRFSATAHRNWEKRDGEKRARHEQ